MKKNELSFEAAVRRLEAIAAELEKDNAALDTSLALYEEGVKLIRYCNSMLEDAERKIKILTVNADGEPQESDFGEANGNSEEN